MLPTRELLLFLVALHSVNSVQLNLGTSLSDFVSTLKQNATQKNDVVIVLDESDSIGEETFLHELEIAEMIAQLMTVSPDFSRLAVMTFSTGYVNHVDYVANSTGSNMCLLIEKIRQIPYGGGGWRKTSEALKHAGDILRNSRPGSNRIIILISDGAASPGYSPSNVAYQLKMSGVVMFAVGVASINEVELLDVATSPKHVFMLMDFRFIRMMNQRLRHDVVESRFDVSSSIHCTNLGCDSNAACACGARGGRYQCVCKPGYFGKGGKGQCQPSPKGTYKDDLGENFKSCPENSTTAGEGATSKAQCSCLGGYEGDPGRSKPCTLVVCTKLTPPEGAIIIPPDCGHTFGTSCDFLCREGYCPYECDPKALAAGTKPWNKITQEPRVCQANKLWSGVEFSCEKVRCSVLKNPENGVIDCTSPSFEYGTRCEVNCNVGHEKTGSDVVFCESNGQWTASLPTCRAITCKPLRPKGKLKLRPSFCTNISVYDAICTYSCEDESFLLLHKETKKPAHGLFRCLADGTWSDSIDNLTCKDVEPPSFTSCPEDIEKSTLPNTPYSDMINWNPPTAKDNVGISSITIIDPPTLFAPPSHFPLGWTRVTYVAEDTSGLKSDPCAFFVTIIDTDPPRVKFCPNDIVIQYHKRSKNVDWIEPEFVDNAGTKKLSVTRNRNPGNQFSSGYKSEVLYIATDAAGNSANCSFTVLIQPYPCKYLPPPKNGYAVCDSEFRKQACSIHCHQGYSFVFPPESLYRCKQFAHGGYWTTVKGRRTGKIRLPWPDCAVAQQPGKYSIQVVSAVATVSCNIDDAKRKLIKQQFINELKSSKIMATLICGGVDACTVENVHIDCRDSASATSASRRIRREKRQPRGELSRVISKRAVDVLERVSEQEKDVPLDPGLKAELAISFSVDLPADIDTRTPVDEYKNPNVHQE